LLLLVTLVLLCLLSVFHDPLLFYLLHTMKVVEPLGDDNI
jgi:hypothetical protein